MPMLRDFIAAALQQAAEAQDLSNRFSRDLARDYQAGILQQLTVPNAFLSELDLELRYAVAGSTPTREELRSTSGEKTPGPNVFDLEVIVAAEQLAQLPEAGLGTLRLRIDFRDFGPRLIEERRYDG
ncbi:MAG TPA: hypothetical protein VEL74_17165 [Thermoanaerobaculia bacterium]|nr:hypothetical protein [Thermoanaerobaculia bacterium]